ncbi:FkbM family methyltransferase [Falsiroseomonas sp.]|uniref:FkbM family methyltransferase n=1 Tax=Falsiroseomonas sp. TaxID=2870721 RepID=UPI0035696114
MMRSAQRVLRTAQTFFPALGDIKAAAQDRLARLTGIPFEADFRALRLFGGEGRLHLDIGANRGQSITAIRMCATRPRIVSFEPNPKLAAALKRRFAEVPGVRIEPVGLGAAEGEFSLHIPSYRGYVFDGLASTDREAAASWLNERTLIGFDPAKLSIETVRCRIRRLDDFGLEPFFIKVDVQGTELQVLQGGQRTIEAHRPVLLLEWPEDELIAWLAARGYRRYAFDAREQVFHHDRGGTLNSFFMTDDKAALVGKQLQ